MTRFLKGYWYEVHWEDAGDRNASLAEAKKLGLFKRKLIGRYCGSTKHAYIFCCDYCPETGDENQDYTIIPKAWIDMGKVRRIAK